MPAMKPILVLLASVLPLIAAGKPDAVVAADGSAAFKTVQEAINASPRDSTLRNPWTILVKPGTYNEVVYIQREKRFVKLLGEDAAKTVITHNLHANLPGRTENPSAPSAHPPSRSTRITFRSRTSLLKTARPGRSGARC
jgi:pectin methylesterase-like acyl-CoA thioesterase